jgi:hypothetical protein
LLVPVLEASKKKLMKSNKDTNNIVEEKERTEAEKEKGPEKKDEEVKVTKITKIKNKIIIIWRKDKLRFWLLVICLTYLIIISLFVVTQFLIIVSWLINS